MFSCVFVTFPYGVLGQVCYFIISIPDRCLLPYFYVNPGILKTYFDCCVAFPQSAIFLQFEIVVFPDYTPLLILSLLIFSIISPGKRGLVDCLLNVLVSW